MLCILRNMALVDYRRALEYKVRGSMAMEYNSKVCGTQLMSLCFHEINKKNNNLHHSSDLDL